MNDRVLVDSAIQSVALEQPQGPHILLVDDDAGMLAALVDCLKHQGFVVTTASNGGQALEQIAVQPPDVMLLDIRMPGQNGLEVLQTVRAEHSSTDLPIIMLSVEDDIETIVSALDLGANDYLQKPPSMEILTARVQTQLQVKRLHQVNRQQIAQLQKLDAMKETFLQIAAHDLKNPLHVMQIGVDLLSDPAASDESSSSEHETIIDSMQQAIQTMQSIINDFLELRAMQEGKIALAVEPVVLAELVRRSLSQFEAYAGDKQIGLSAELEPDLPPVSADPNRLLQVLNNLLSNAIKFSPSGGSVMVRLRSAGGCLRVEVEDKGPGIVAEEIPLLFQEFTRLSNHPTGRERSSGVGLAIVRHIVELHQGRLGVDSEVGRGSCFWFELPLA